MKILTAEQMRRVDERTESGYGISSETLMDNAGLAICETLLALYSDLAASPPIILCGKGNNGGDGVTAARHLKERGVTSRVVLLSETQIPRATDAGVTFEQAFDDEAWSRVAAGLDDHPVIVDSLLGTGLTGGARGLAARVIDDINACARGQVVAVDIPSGLSGDTAEIPGPAVQADHTIALAFPKMPHVFDPASLLTGHLHVVDIGIPDAAAHEEKVGLNLTTEEDVAGLVPVREPAAHKGDCGRILIVGGSAGKSGAVAMVGLAALRSGAGLVTAAIPSSVQPVVAGHVMEMMTEGLPETHNGALSFLAEPFLRKLMVDRDILAVGPGLTIEEETTRLVREIVVTTALPVILDADGINAFAGHTDDLKGDGVLILTPHPGEMARLTGMTTAEVQADRVTVTQSLADELGCYLVLKGRHTVIAAPGGQTWINPTGNPGMATGGSGDVLTGVLAGLIGQGLSPLDTCLLGVYVHGVAADLAAEDLGETSLIAGDIIDFLPEAFDCLGS